MSIKLLTGIPKLANKGWKKKEELKKSFRYLEKKIEKVGKERKIRIEKQKKEYFDRTGKKLKIEESK